MKNNNQIDYPKELYKDMPNKLSKGQKKRWKLKKQKEYRESLKNGGGGNKAEESKEIEYPDNLYDDMPTGLSKGQKKKWKTNKRAQYKKQQLQTQQTTEEEKVDSPTKKKKPLTKGEKIKQKKLERERQRQIQLEKERAKKLEQEKEELKDILEELCRKAIKIARNETKQERIKKQKEEGTYLTPAQLRDKKQAEANLQALLKQKGITLEEHLKQAENKNEHHVVKRRKKKKKHHQKPVVQEIVVEEEKVKEEVKEQKQNDNVIEADMGSWDDEDDDNDKKDSKQNVQDAAKEINEQMSKQEDEKMPVIAITKVEKEQNQYTSKSRKKSEEKMTKQQIKYLKREEKKRKRKEREEEERLRKLSKEMEKKQRKLSKQIEEEEKLNESPDKDNLSKPTKKKRRKMTEEEKLLEPQGVTIGRNKYRNPICCILGHVDAGKTLILDIIRNTKVQEKEAGGITQQIGATMLPQKVLFREVKKVENFYPLKIQIPGILFIDTPGHESFSNLRGRGASLCDIAVLVIDINRGVQKQTIESIELLKANNIPFVIAINKVDRIYGWKSQENASSYNTLTKQEKHTKHEYESSVENVMIQMQENGFNSAPFYRKNFDPFQEVALVPTSAITGEGIPDLLACITNMAQLHLTKKLQKKNKFRASVMECNKIEGLGATIDIILVTGKLKIGDKICVLGFDGPSITQIKGLYVPEELKELKLQDQYKLIPNASGSIGVKITGENLENAVAGSAIYLIKDQDDERKAKRNLLVQLENIKKNIQHQKFGVCVQASTLGALEALIKYLNRVKIPIAQVGIGPVTKRIVQIAGQNLQQMVSGRKMKKQYATVLSFNVKILPDAQDEARESGVKIISKEVIYHLLGEWKKHVEICIAQDRIEYGKGANFPVILEQIMHINKKAPLILGAKVIRGQLRIGQKLCIHPSKRIENKQTKKQEIIHLGEIVSMEHEKKALQGPLRQGSGDLAIKLNSPQKILAGRHFTLEDQIVSFQNRESIDKLKELYKSEMTRDDWLLMRDFKGDFEIQ